MDSQADAKNPQKFSRGSPASFDSICRAVLRTGLTTLVQKGLQHGLSLRVSKAVRSHARRGLQEVSRIALRMRSVAKRLDSGGVSDAGLQLPSCGFSGMQCSFEIEKSALLPAVKVLTVSV